jgi:hypothetical protein
VNRDQKKDTGTASSIYYWKTGHRQQEKKEIAATVDK